MSINYRAGARSRGRDSWAGKRPLAPSPLALLLFSLHPLPSFSRSFLLPSFYPRRFNLSPPIATINGIDVGDRARAAQRPVDLSVTTVWEDCRSRYQDFGAFALQVT